MKQIVFACVNASLNLTYELPQFNAGALHRCSAPIQTANGKGAVAARAFKQLGGNPFVVIPCGGPNGIRILTILKQAEIDYVHIPVAIATRATYTIIETQSTPPVETLLLEEGGSLLDSELLETKERLYSACKQADVCCFLGSLPVGVPPSFFNSVMDRVRSDGRSCEFFIDSVHASLDCLAASSPEYLKVNDSELARLVGTEPPINEAGCWNAISRVINETEIQFVIVTRGGSDLLAVSRSDGCFRVSVPVVKSIRSTVGSGDAFTAGFLRKISASFQERLQFGVAAASANLANSDPGLLDLTQFESYREAAQVSRVARAP